MSVVDVVSISVFLGTVWLPVIKYYFSESRVLRGLIQSEEGHMKSPQARAWRVVGTMFGWLYGTGYTMIYRSAIFSTLLLLCFILFTLSTDSIPNQSDLPKYISAWVIINIIGDYFSVAQSSVIINYSKKGNMSSLKAFLIDFLLSAIIFSTFFLIALWVNLNIWPSNLTFSEQLRLNWHGITGSENSAHTIFFFLSCFGTFSSTLLTVFVLPLGYAFNLAEKIGRDISQDFELHLAMAIQLAFATLTSFLIAAALIM